MLISKQEESRSPRERLDEMKVICRFNYLLGIGHSEEEAVILLAVNGLDFDTKIKTERWGDSMSLTLKKIRLCGEVLAQRYSTWAKGKEFLSREHPDHISYMDSISGH